MVVLLATTAPMAYGQSGEAHAAQADNQKTFNIPAQPLASALTAFGEQSGLQFSVDSSVIANARTAGVSGHLATADALRRLLAGSGIVFRFTAANTVVLEKPDVRGARQLGVVSVEGAYAGGGANGSSDPTATEGTHSYTTAAVSVASKTAETLRNTPQGVAVITQQQLQDQKLDDITAVLTQMPSIVLTYSGSNLDPTITSHGFEVSNFQIDGGAPINVSSSVSSVNILGYGANFDMAQYDHVEMVQGADGLFTGNGEAAGTINLVRKRPLDHNQVLVDVSVGSWDNYRLAADVTGPINIDGLGAKLRGRLVMTYQTQNYFYSVASNKQYLYYGIVEGDLSSTTLLTLGASYQQQNAVPWYGGLPRYLSGADLKLPRSTSYALPWNRSNTSNPQLFAELKQTIGEDWTLKVKFTDTYQNTFRKYGYVFGQVKDDGTDASTLRGSQSKYGNRQEVFDASLSGGFDFLDRHHELTVGGSFMHTNGAPGTVAYNALYSSPYTTVGVESFDASSYAEPASSSVSISYQDQYSNQYTAYLKAKFEVLKDLHVGGGFSVAGYNYRYSALTYSSGKVSGSYVTNYTGDLAITPYGAAQYDVDENWSVYFSYTSIYNPQIGVYESPGVLMKPATGGTYNTGIKGELFDGALNVGASFYRTIQKNLASSTLNPNYEFSYEDGYSCCYLANGLRQSQGVDVTVAGQVLPGLDLTASFNYNDNTVIYDDTTSKIGTQFSTRTPPYMGKLWASYRLPDDFDKLRVGFGVNTQSSAFYKGTVCLVYKTTTGTSCKTSQAYAFEQAGYAVFNGSLSYDIDEHWMAQFNVNNILDKTYYKTVGTTTGGNWYGDPRNFTFTLRFKN